MKPAILVLVLLSSIAAPAGAADSQPRRIEEAFANDRFDRFLWKTDQIGARVDPVGGQLTILVPPGGEGRPPVGLKSRFTIEGDFDVRAPYRIGSWNMPKKHWINLSIVVSGPDGVATVIRTNHSQVGSGYSYWYGPADKERKGDWKQEPSKDSGGWLRLKRSGDEIQFFSSGPGEPNFHQFGAIDFGTAPITSLMFQLSVPEMPTPVTVAFGKIEIEAERVIEPPRPADSRLGLRFWLGAGVVLLVAGGLGAWAWRRARNPAGSPVSSGRPGRRGRP